VFDGYDEEVIIVGKERVSKNIKIPAVSGNISFDELDTDFTKIELSDIRKSATLHKFYIQANIYPHNEVGPLLSLQKWLNGSLGFFYYKSNSQPLLDMKRLGYINPYYKFEINLFAVVKFNIKNEKIELKDSENKISYSETIPEMDHYLTLGSKFTVNDWVMEENYLNWTINDFDFNFSNEMEKASWQLILGGKVSNDLREAVKFHKFVKGEPYQIPPLGFENYVSKNY